ncbi:MAG: RNA polymerase sigma factor [Solirubrobacteraceae bacterium]
MRLEFGAVAAGSGTSIGLRGGPIAFGRRAGAGARTQRLARSAAALAMARRRKRERRSDQELLAAALRTEPEAFTAFYERHVDVVLAFLRRRTSSPEVAADLMAETFAAALLALHETTEPEDLDVPVAWLLGIARNKLYDSYRRGRVEAAARQRLGLEPLVLDDNDLALVDELSESDLVRQLADVLPPDQLQALRLRVIDELDYEQIARELDCSEAVVRKRVSRALSALRSRLDETP